MNVDNPEEPTSILQSYPGTSELKSTPESGTATLVGPHSSQHMVDLYSLPVNDLVAEIHRLWQMCQSLNRDLATKDQIIEAGRKANQTLIKKLAQIRSLTNS